jgi:GTP:adenosylcobinamide-phosphate guanylyltransferase
MNVAAIIPARGGSKRLPRKNITPVLGAPMLAWVIQACRGCRLVSDVYVSTEDPEIAETAVRYGATVIPRPVELAGDVVQKHEAIVHAAQMLLAQGQALDLVISAQPNSPEMRSEDLTAGIEKLQRHGLWELFSVDAQLLQNGAFRILRRDTVFLNTLSVHAGVLVTDYVDVHTAEDLERAAARLRGRAGLVVPQPAMATNRREGA